MAVTANPVIQAKVTKTYTPDGASEQSVALNQYDRSSARYDASSTYPVTEAAADQLTPGNGTINLDLTALNDLSGGTTVSMSGRKIRYLQLQCPSTNTAAVKVKTGASNGYVINGSEGIWVHPGCTVAVECRNGLAAVGGSTKILDVVGTVAGDKINYVIAGGE